MHSSAPGDAEPSRIQELHEAIRERERAHAQLRQATAQLLQDPTANSLRAAVAAAMVRELVSRVRYAAALKPLGWPVPDHLLLDMPPEHHP
ncbi:hypothetical protein [Actinopolymorpha pittospori]|uniref:Uncharacterized protein n=1 Tax=Actinopolymorpha pittospori TaxID=648752 RepID=A0A927R9D5_9ACTN|nr:hypothetical protein [Actinopolymorpha pittospori]MBE1603870.1 hypothetical protein [Actinopolymorpha pittospori]